MSSTFWQTQLTATEALITAYLAAITALVANPTLSYTLDTGQDRQVVTKVDLVRLNTQLNSLYNRYATLEARCNGSGSFTSQPAW